MSEVQTNFYKPHDEVAKMTNEQANVADLDSVGHGWHCSLWVFLLNLLASAVKNKPSSDSTEHAV